jgi:hypothetical protein
LRSDLISLWPAVARDGAPADLLLETARRIISIHKAAGQYLEPVYKPVAKALNAALPGKPQPLVLTGIFYIEWAWEARGGGFANTVKDEEWKLFAQRLAVAEEALKQAYEMAPDHPAAATEMITVELGQGKGVVDLWFGRAMAADPDNFDACLRKLVYIEPKWNGSAQEMLGFSEECFRSGNYAGRLPMVLAIAHRSLATYLDKPETYYAQPAVWRDMQRVYEPYLRVRPEDVDARSAYCAFACMGGHWDTAVKQFSLLGNNVIPAWFGSGTLEDVKQFRQKAMSKSGPADGL